MRYAHGRYLLFEFDRFYPQGGLNDLVGSFDLMIDVKKAIKDNDRQKNYFHVFDTKTKKILKLNSRGIQYR